MWLLVLEFPSFTMIFNGLQHSFQVWRGLILFLEGFLIHPNYIRKKWMVVFNDILVSRMETKLADIKKRDFLH